MDESICWLWANGQREKALEIAKKALKTNGKELACLQQETSHSYKEVPTVASKKSIITFSSSNEISTTTMDLFRSRYPNLRRRTLVMLYCWFASCLCYLGLSFNSVKLFGNPHLMFTISILAEIPGHFISIFLVSKTGNKPMFFTSLLITGVSCVAVPLLPDGKSLFFSRQFLNHFFTKRDLKRKKKLYGHLFPTGSVAVCITMIAKLSATVSFNIINSYTAELFPTTLRNTAVGLCMMTARAGGALIPQINLLSTAVEEVPTITFGVVGIFASLLVLTMLPETMNKDIPQTVEDVETSNDAYPTMNCIPCLTNS